MWLPFCYSRLFLAVAGVALFSVNSYAGVCERLFVSHFAETAAAKDARIADAYVALARTGWPAHRKLTASQQRLIHRAHWYAFGEKGMNGQPATIGNYTIPQKVGKLWILVGGRREFTLGQARALADARVIGIRSSPLRPHFFVEDDGRDLLNEGRPFVNDSADGNQPFNHLILQGAAHEVIYAAYLREKAALERSVQTRAGGSPEYHLNLLKELWVEYNKATIYGTLPIQRLVPLTGEPDRPPQEGMILSPPGYWIMPPGYYPKLD